MCWHPKLARWLLCLVAALLGCDSGEPADGTAEIEAAEVVRRGNGGDPGSLDPALAEDLHAFNVLLDLYEGLLTAGADGSIGPGVAHAWSVSANGLEYRFQLREDARWSNGWRVTAQHFEHGFRQVLGPGGRSPAVHLLAPVAGFQAEGDGVFMIRLRHPAPWFATVLTMPVAMPRLPVVHDDAASFWDPARFVGNGPYLLEERQPGGVLRLRRNEEFHAADSVAVNRVEFHPLTDPQAESRLFRAGGLDVTATIPPAEYPALLEERPDEVFVTPGLGLYYLAFDLTEPPLDDRNLRRALSLAIDRERLIGMLARGERAATGLVPPGVRAHPAAVGEWEVLGRSAREREARAALAHATTAGRPPVIRLSYDAGDVHENVALALRAMWKDVLGIEVALRQLEWKAFLDQRVDRAAWDIMRFVWVGDYDDASTFTDLFVTAGSQNLPGYANPRYDELVVRAAGATDAESRRDLLMEAEQMLLDDYAIAPLYFMTNKHLVSPRVSGYLPNALDRHPSRFIRLDPRSGSS